LIIIESSKIHFLIYYLNIITYMQNKGARNLKSSNMDVTF
jgi:hypothetical protein